MSKEAKLGKLHDLMAYGDDLDAFYSMNKTMLQPQHTECDREIMNLLNEAKKEALPFAIIEQWEDWFKKWFGEGK